MKQTSEIESLFSENYHKLYACTFRLVGNHQDAEDVLQTAFLKAYQHQDQFRQESTLYTWVYRIVLNECYRFMEYSKQLPLNKITEKLGVDERTFFESLEYTPDFTETLVMDELREKCLQAFLKCVPKNQRVCFLLKTCLKLKNKEIAQILDISEENVKVTLHRGRKKLQELLEMRCNLVDPDKPCKCHLWIHFMKERGLPLPTGYQQVKMENLKTEYFKNMSMLKKLDYLYTVEAAIDQATFLHGLKKAVEIL